jgi:hypothetical protein
MQLRRLAGRRGSIAGIRRAILGQAFGDKAGEGRTMDGFWRHFVCLVAAGPLLLSATFEARAAPDDVRICAKETGDAAIDACSRAIRNARALKIRAQVYEAKGDTARAEADLAAAKQLGE